VISPYFFNQLRVQQALLSHSDVLPLDDLLLTKQLQVAGPGGTFRAVHALPLPPDHLLDEFQQNSTHH